MVIDVCKAALNLACARSLALRIIHTESTEGVKPKTKTKIASNTLVILRDICTYLISEICCDLSDTLSQNNPYDIFW